jgi:hypothetical protein
MTMRLLQHIWSRVVWILALLAVAVTALAGLKTAGERKVSFHAKGPVGLAINGRGGDLSVRESGEWVEVSVGLASLKTGIALRYDVEGRGEAKEQRALRVRRCA